MYGGDPGFAFEHGGSWADWRDNHMHMMPLTEYISTKLPKDRIPFRQGVNDGGRIGFANGGENIIGADLKEKESVFFPKGDFENIRATSPTRTDYNIRSTEDLVRNVNPFGIVGEIGAPAAALAISRPYDMIQAGARTTPSDIDRAIQSGALTPREIASFINCNRKNYRSSWTFS